ncbi:hypothetical protein C6P86_00590 [Burkholderia multivorans]|nr:hypothetical protein C6P86_00590 [Burkholderia multivorans]PRE91020.1 hypothetical protein C6Q00_02075 [Burkholderia multivorans]
MRRCADAPRTSHFALRASCFVLRAACCVLRAACCAGVRSVCDVAVCMVCAMRAPCRAAPRRAVCAACILCTLTAARAYPRRPGSTACRSTARCRRDPERSSRR